MTGPVPRHDHQSIDQWAQQGLVHSEGRTSPESDVPPVPDSGGLEAARIPTDPAGPPDQTDGGTGGGSGGGTGGGSGGDPEDPVTAGGRPGTVASPGDAAETAAFEGDGSYSEGWHASGPSAD